MEKRPIGVTIFAIINLVICGFFSLFFLIYLINNPSALESIVSNTLPKDTFDLSQINTRQVQTASFIHLLFPLIFIVSGIGLLLKKEWARKLTLYFAVILALLSFLSVIFYPSLTARFLLQIIYPGILIFYFTNKNIESYFKEQTKE